MLHIVLALLKIIGILLASLLGLAIFLLLLVLIVPIRYGIRADNQGGIRAEGRVSWLFRILYIRMTYLDEKFIIRLRLFGKVFYDSSKSNEKKTKVKKSKTKKTVKRSDMREKSIKEKNKVDKVQDDSRKSDLKINHSQSSVEKVLDKSDKKEDIIKNKPELFAVQLPDKPEIRDEDSIDSKSTSENKLKSKSVAQKVKEFFASIKEFFLNFKKRVLNFWNRIRNLWRKLKDLDEKWKKVKAFLADEVNKAALLASFQSLKKFLKHLRPTRLKLDVEFGTGDPCTTGQALGVLGVLYSFYGNSLKVVPNFEEEILKGSINCIGRIRLFTLLIIGLQLVFDKNFRNLLKNAKTLKEDL